MNLNDYPFKGVQKRVEDCKTPCRIILLNFFRKRFFGVDGSSERGLDRVLISRSKQIAPSLARESMRIPAAPTGETAAFKQAN